jgi:hypothetical protein
MKPVKMSIRAAFGLTLTAGIAIGTPAAADMISEMMVEQRAEVTAEASWYPRKAAHAGQSDSFVHVEARPELFVAGDEIEVLVQPRLTTANRGSGQADLREAHVSGRFGEADFLVGSTILFWGQTEIYNPVDIVNSRDFSRGLQRSEKRGAPMARLSWPAGPGQLDVMAVDFVQNIYPERPLRERIAPAVNNSKPTFSGKAKQSDLATALRWSGYVGDLDIGVSWFRGTGNAPRLLPQADGTMTPDYSRVTQAGVDLQYLMGETAVKGEVIHRSGQYDTTGMAKTYRAGVIGVERTIYDFDGAGRDMVLIGEYAYDSRKLKAHSGFQNDIAVGARFLWNDVEDTEVMALVIRDLDNGAQTTSISASRRINDEITFDAAIRHPTRYGHDAQSAALSRDMAVIASLTYSY